jgi:hypothetical protein
MVKVVRVTDQLAGVASSRIRSLVRSGSVTDLRASMAGGRTFLMPPATGRSERTGRQTIDDRRQVGDDPRHKRAVLVFEVTAAPFGARCREAEGSR